MVKRKLAVTFSLALLAGAAGCAQKVAQSADQAALAAAEGSDATEPLAAMKLALNDNAGTIAKLSTEVMQLRARESELTNALKQAIRERTGQAKSAQAPAPAAVLAFQEQVSDLQKQLAQERQKRSELEAELVRLKAETSGSAFSKKEDSEEVASLRAELAEERVKRRHLLAELNALQQRGQEAAQKSKSTDGNGSSADSRALRARLLELETRHQEAMVGLARTVAADRKRQESLMAELAAVRGGAAAAAPLHVEPAVLHVSADGDGDGVIAVRAENDRLRSMLEEEREHNARLSAKLKLAGRVTDLIFKMQRQGVDGAPQPEAAEAPAP